MTDELLKIVQKEAQKVGMSNKHAEKAAKMLRSGKINMAQIAPQLTQMIMQNVGSSTNATRDELRERLATKRRAIRDSRKSKFVKEQIYESVKQRKEENDKRLEEEKIQQAKREQNRQKRHKQKMRDLEKKLGTISVELYNDCLKKQNTGTGTESEQNRVKNIIELYHRQQKFEDTINLEEFDGDELSDIEDD